MIEIEGWWDWAGPLIPSGHILILIQHHKVEPGTKVSQVIPSNVCVCVFMDVWLLTRIWHESSTLAECYMFSHPTDRAADRRDDFSRSSDESLSMILCHILSVFSLRPPKHPFSFCPSPQHA